MRRLSSIAAALLAASVLTPAAARADFPASAVRVTFRLHVAGRSDADSTYWVAYGPLGGRFGILRLMPRGNGLYSVTAALPSGRTIFTFLQAHGYISTAAGMQPGSGVTIARSVGPTTATRAAASTVHLHVPAG